MIRSRQRALYFLQLAKAMGLVAFSETETIEQR